MKTTTFYFCWKPSVVILSVLITGCGGGGGNASPPPSPSIVAGANSTPTPAPTPTPTPTPTPAPTPAPAPAPTYVRPRVAHAGGGYNGFTYTDSIEALDFNANSYELFELDFEWTSDNHLVCIHDWTDYAQTIFGQQFQPAPTFAEYELLVDAETNFKNCTAESVVDWLINHPGKRIVTDIKTDNVRGLQYFADIYPDFADRIVPQIYQPEEYQQVKDIGYKDIIWTLYMYSGDNSDVLANAQHMSLYAVTMPGFRAKEDFVYDLAVRGFPTYVHTFNTERNFELFRDRGVTEIYTDWLLPT